MPTITIPTGAHTPITNIVASESVIEKQQISHGSVGTGEVLELVDGTASEVLPTPEVAFESSEVVQWTAPSLENLSDIGVASFGTPPAFEAVLGTDERVRIADTTVYPWRTIASLLITAADNSQWIGTAWFISPRTLVTAGHCVFIKHSGVVGRDGWVKKIQVMPGRNADILPFGGITATEFWSVKGWGEDGSENYDYGAIVLPAAFPQELGFFGYGVFTDEDLLASVANVGGYPGDKPKGTLWYDKREIGSVKPDKVFYAADTAGGQSGTAAYIVRNGERVAVGIHAYGGQTSNSGTRISSQVFANLESWKRD
ncbi:V8-like Glu-specific endopeptidase [Roseimicrobium gellanilyticum]|uniref:Serine protease n=1 Tax=Roseimicrobium gellanilyticum TaxID=748857 RepID=A0A366H8U0_9BACT|nr:serine protease [Roseimicrobium gellanilyticum]RBP38640.1 V8-like Glu-specific endopeptidase [Roseimicrobium gellanilyticum]